jgi:hypothetical protein
VVIWLWSVEFPAWDLFSPLPDISECGEEESGWG